MVDTLRIRFVFGPKRPPLRPFPRDVLQAAFQLQAGPLTGAPEGVPAAAALRAELEEEKRERRERRRREKADARRKEAELAAAGGVKLEP